VPQHIRTLVGGLGSEENRTNRRGKTAFTKTKDKDILKNTTMLTIYSF